MDVNDQKVPRTAGAFSTGCHVASQRGAGQAKTQAVLSLRPESGARRQFECTALRRPAGCMSLADVESHGLSADGSVLPYADLKQLPPDDSYSACVRESHRVMFDTAEKAMAAAGIAPRQVHARTSPCQPAVRAPVWWEGVTALAPEAHCQCPWYFFVLVANASQRLLRHVCTRQT